MSEDSLSRQRLGQGLLMYKDLPPMRLGLRPYYRDRRLRSLRDGRGNEENGPRAIAVLSALVVKPKERLAQKGPIRLVVARFRRRRK